MLSNPRFTVHPPTVQQIPPSYRNPKKRLSHATKITPSGATPGGMLQAIRVRMGLQ